MFVVYTKRVCAATVNRIRHPITRGQFNKETTGCSLQAGPLFLQAHAKKSSINIVTSPSYKSPACNYG